MLTAVIVSNAELSIAVYKFIKHMKLNNGSRNHINASKHLYLCVLHQADSLAHVDKCKDMTVIWMIKII